MCKIEENADFIRCASFIAEMIMKYGDESEKEGVSEDTPSFSFTFETISVIISTHTISGYSGGRK